MDDQGKNSNATATADHQNEADDDDGGAEGDEQKEEEEDEEPDDGTSHARSSRNSASLRLSS